MRIILNQIYKETDYNIGKHTYKAREETYTIELAM